MMKKAPKTATKLARANRVSVAWTVARSARSSEVRDARRRNVKSASPRNAAKNKNAVAMASRSCSFGDPISIHHEPYQSAMVARQNQRTASHGRQGWVGVCSGSIDDWRSAGGIDFRKETMQPMAVNNPR